MKKKILLVAYNILSRRNYSSKELKEKLQRKSYTEEEIAPLMERLKQQGYIDDQALMEGEIARGKRLRYGPGRIARRLSERLGTSFYEAMELLEQHYSAEEQIENAKEVVFKKKFTERSKAFRHLYAQGYDNALIAPLLETIGSEEL
ncbi:MAG: recombination regulator RecX [Simkaniaceae bacterium]|nr:recombination regulator RecX [Simkaniaceae bacterium]